MSTHGEGGSPTMTSIFRRIPSIRERARRGSLGQVSGGAALHDAIAKGKIHLAKFILDAVEGQMIVNSRDPHGKTPLIRAVRLEDTSTRLRATELLLQRGASVNLKDNVGRTALSYAAEMHFNDVIRILMKNNVDPNIFDNNGNTPLIHCALTGNATGICILTKSFRRLGLEVNRFNSEGLSALMIAAKSGSVDCMKLLAHEGRACLDQRDRIRNMTAEEWAREGGCSTPEMEAFLPKFRRQAKPPADGDSSSSDPGVDRRSSLRKNESLDSTCSSTEGCSPRTSKNSSSEELSTRRGSGGVIVAPTPPSYRKSTHPQMDALSRRFHALHPIKTATDTSSFRQHVIEMKRASLPEVTLSGDLPEPEHDIHDQRDTSPRSQNPIFIKRSKHGITPRRPLSAINRHSNHRQSKSFDGVTYEHNMSNSVEDLRAKSFSVNYLMSPHSKNLINLSFLSRSSEALSPPQRRAETTPGPGWDQVSLSSSVKSAAQISVDIEPGKTDQQPAKNMLTINVNGQSDLVPTLPPLSPKRGVKGS